MKNLVDYNIFTDDELALHDLELAIKVNQATTAHVTRRVVRMSTPQQLRAASLPGRKDLEFDLETLNAIIGKVKN